MANFLKQKRSITLIAALTSLFTLLAFHLPLFKVVVSNLEGGFNGVIITGGFAALILATNFLIYNLLLYTLRGVGKWIIGATLIGDAIMLYFVNSYDVLVTDSMMGNVFNTRFSEASGFFSFAAVLYTLLLGILPAVLLICSKIDYSTIKRFGKNSGIAFLVMLGVVGANFNNFTWIDRHATKLGSLLMPWSYIVNSIRWHNAEKKRNAKEILLPDATINSTDKQLVVLMIGESARRENFSLYGYERKTNPLLEKQDITALTATSAATYTTAGVKAILDHMPTDKLYEILPNYLYRTGVDVIWRTNNWGEPPLHIEKVMKVADIKALHPEADERYDAILFEGLKEQIESSAADKVFVVLHLNTSHGPTYNTKYPASFEQFTPVCTTVEMSKAVPEELINAYDNSILYTDYLVNSAIELAKSIERESCVIFISDHGESLGENNLYMHGVPMAMAPREQIEIPFIVWSSDEREIKSLPEAGQYNIFHTVLGALDITSDIYNEQINIFAEKRNN